MTDGSKRNPGRPPGSGAVARLRAQLAEGGKLDLLLTKVHDLAMAGDMAAMRILMDRLIPPLRAEAAPAGFTLRSGNLTEQAKALMRATARGAIPPDQASELINALATVARIEEVDELRRRVEALESEAGT